MRKSTQKKILGGTLIVAFLATLGAVLVTAETDDITKDENTFLGFECDRRMGDRQPFFSELSEEKQQEINKLSQQLIEEDSTPEEMRTAIGEKLAEFGVELPDRDEMLDEQIQHATQHLEILDLKKQLREEGYSWEEIQDVISEEYDLDSFINHPGGMRGMNGRMGCFGGGKLNNPDNEIAEDSEI